MTDVDQTIENILNYIYDETGVQFIHNWPPVAPHYRVGRANVQQCFIADVDAPQRLQLDFLYGGNDIEDIKAALVDVKQLISPINTLEDFSEYDEAESIRDTTNQFNCTWNAWTTGTGKSFTKTGAAGVLTDNSAAGGDLIITLTHTAHTWVSGDSLTISFTVDSVTSSGVFLFGRILAGSTVIGELFYLMKTAGGFTMYGGKDAGYYFSSHEFTVGAEIDIEISYLSDSSFTIRARENGGSWMSSTANLGEQGGASKTFSGNPLTIVSFSTGSWGNLVTVSFTEILADWYKYYPSGIVAQSNPVVTELGQFDDQWYYSLSVDIEV